MSKQYTLGKKERLKSRKLIEKVFKEGKSFSVFPFRIYYLISQETSLSKSGPGLQFGVGVSKKNFNSAVDRNRIKRLTREAYRLQKQIIKQRVLETNTSLSLFFIFTAKELPAYPAVYEKMQVILKRIMLISDENGINPA